MPKPFVKLLILLVCQFAAGSIASAQTADAQARESEWRNYKLPPAEFSRFVDASKIVLFRAPAGWQRSAGYLSFKGPHDAELRVVVEKIADGIPLKSYTNAVLQNLRNIPGGADSLTVRPTEISGLEAREFFFSLPDLRGETSRRMIWCTVSGPNAVSFVFMGPETHAAELEPFFKAVIESVVIFESDAEYSLFEGLRAAAIKENKPARIDQVRSLIEAIAGFNDQARAKAVEALIAIFDSTPDAAVELLMDRDPIVRASAIEALGRSSTRSLDGFLVRALADQRATVAVRAARSLSKRDDIVKLLREDSAGWEGLQRNRVMRMAPFLNEQARNQLVDELLRYKGNLNGPSAGKKVAPLPPPPPPGKAPPRRPSQPKGGTSPEPESPKLKSLGVVNVSAGTRSYSDKQEMVLEFLPDLEAIAPVLPASKLLEDEQDAELALDLALESRTRLPVDSLMNLLSSKDPELTHLVALNLAISASGRDIPRIDEAAKKAAPDSPMKLESKSVRPLTEELRVSIKKIRWRERLEAADSTSREALFKEAFADDELAAWAWPYVRDHIEAPGPKQSKPLRGAKAIAGGEEKKLTVGVSPLAENLLPAGVTLYTAIPDVGGFIATLGESLSSIQLDSARAQAKLLLVFRFFETQFGKFFGVRPGSSLVQSSGLKPHSAAVFARWTADGAPRGLSTAQRKAVIFRVQDRDRLEQLVASYHAFGNFENLPEYVSLGVRFISAFPAVLPLSASIMGGQSPAQPEQTVLSTQNLIAYEICEGYPVTVFERRQKLRGGLLKRDMIYMACVGDAAILAFDWFSLRDCLVRIAGKGETLASNASFKQAVAAGGDVIYMSEPLVLIGSAASKARTPKLVERGALRISKAGWESTFDLSFGGTGWQKLFGFKPAALKSPAVLLPRSTVAYLLMRFDFAAAWRLFASDVFGAESAKQFASSWALDFEREVLPELGPECGAALLGMPTSSEGKLNVPWALFIQTRSDKLSKALAEGKLLKGAAAGASSAKVKLGNSDYWVAARKGFLILANNEAAISKFDSTEYLAGTKEFEKALKSAPAEVVAFGGVSIDTATAGVATGKDSTSAEGVEVLLSLARAFHGLTLHAAAKDNGLSASMSVSLDREGRYSVSDLASLAKEFQFATAEIEARGVPIVDQRRIDSLAMRITSKAPGSLQRIRQDVTSASQSVEDRPDGSILLTVKPRRAVVATKQQLPITAPELAEFLKPAGLREDVTVASQAREIAGKDQDAWSVARKLSDWTFKNLKWKRVDGASAGATLATREADCLEFSELFVAMARSIGLPARIVSGLVHSGSSFGGHAWVEVWVGEWVELDPTWGTNFVDATHVRSSSSELLAYAALNVIGIEVVDTRREFADFQKDPKALAEAICEEFNGHRAEALSVAVDPAVLTDALMGEGSWVGLTGAEREQIYSSHHRLIGALQLQFGNNLNFGAGARLLKLNRRADNGGAVLLMSGSGVLVRLELIQKDGAWFVREMKYEDLDYNTIAEALRPTVLLLQAKRKGVAPPRMLDSGPARILKARDQDLKLALQVADLVLAENPGSKTVRYLRGICLLETTEAANKVQVDEAIKILSSLADEPTNYAPAIRQLGEHYASADEDDAELKNKQEKAIEFLKRYSLLVPEDPRPHQTMAQIYEAREDHAAAEAAYRAAVELDPLDPDNYSALARYLVIQKRFKEALAAVDQTRGRGTSKDQIFANLFFTMFDQPGGLELADGLAAESSVRLANSFQANVNLASVRINADHAREALPLLKRAIELDPKSNTPHKFVARAHRNLHNWVLALKAADTAVALDPKDPEAHFYRACALAQLRRPADAIRALRRTFELNAEWYDADEIEEEPDLKPLASLPSFKKLVAEIRRSEAEQAGPQKKEPDKQN
jgi:Flp pilus assembly protein TadD